MAMEVEATYENGILRPDHDLLKINSGVAQTALSGVP